MNKKYDLAILGAGSGGLVAAATACGMGASVLLIENRKMGGDCLNYGCVPSKTFLKSCRTIKNIKQAHNYGISVEGAKPSLEKIMARVQSVIAEIAPHDSVERFRGLGADVVLGHGEVVSKNSVKVGDEVFDARKIIIATGSTADIPPIEGLRDVEYYTNETIFELRTLPSKMIVLGSGPIGLELGQGFAALGSEVHVVSGASVLFPKDEPEVSGIMHDALKEDGVNFHLGCKILSVTEQDGKKIVHIQKEGQQISLSCDLLLVALGRKPNTQNIGLEKVGVKTNEKGFIVVNDKLQTTADNIYACGDVRGRYMFTHSAGYEGIVAVKNALIAPMFKTSYQNIAWTTYTSPEVAHVGLLESEAKTKGAYTRVINISDNDRAKAEDDRTGIVKLVLDKKSRILGATIVGAKAGEMIVPLSLMVTQKLRLSAALNIIYSYPIQGEIVKTLAGNDFKSRVKPWQQSLVRKIVNRS